tara:strand:- start:6318 stop:7328 length:1011 start_codon:yes stop_codon:yes gene_type:complete
VDGETMESGNNLGTFFDDLEVGQILPPSPDLTITSGEIAIYQSICGDPLPASLSLPLAEKITGVSKRVVNPGLVMDISIGQSTVATRKVIANLFYRGVSFQRPVFEGETLHTEVKIKGLKDLSLRKDRTPRGLALLGITTTCVEDGSTVVDYERCAMLKARDPEKLPGHDDDLGSVETEIVLDEWEHLVPSSWDLSSLKITERESLSSGEIRVDELRDTVSNAMELVRLTQNQAPVHRDASTSAAGERLVYGGHTIGMAQASLSRVMPGIATILGWQSCDHLGPVHEGDVLSFHHTLLDQKKLNEGTISAIKTEVVSTRGSEGSDVLDWRLVVFGV